MTTEAMLARPGPRHHLVQFYVEETYLVHSVSRYLREGAERGEWLAAVATPAHLELIKEALRQWGLDPDGLLREGRLVFFDAVRTLAQLMPGGQLDRARFEEAIGGPFSRMLARAGSAGMRAYGETVDLLWKEGRLSAATRLEGYWDRLLECGRLGILCSYNLDILSPRIKDSMLQELISVHTHLIPARPFGELEIAVERAMNEVLGEVTVGALMPLIRANVFSRIVMPAAEQTVLWVRKNLPPYASEVLARARIHYEDECARSRRPAKESV